MCYSVFIATSTPQITSEFVPDETVLYLTDPSEDELNGLKEKFSLPFIYCVGSDTQCSCGLEFHSHLFDDPEWQDSKSSPQALLDLLNKLTILHFIEYYCCWDGDWHDPIEHTRVLNSHDISLDKNYFELVEGEYVRFEKTSDKFKATASVGAE